ncbi:MAG: DUF1844 domain-containing protein [Thermoguttaceae bacterium]|jgi:hypothetical protein|nr:DUF1844 domain-containing protein [Thermoguttaceae bacterium]
MTEQPDHGEKKIIVDEDWKSQVDAERKAARRQTQPESGDEPPGSQADLPEPSLMFLFGGLYLQGMVALGLLPNPETDTPERNLPLARHTIDTLDMLREKTEGNRTPEETRELETILHQLRLAFVAAEKPA